MPSAEPIVPSMRRRDLLYGYLGQRGTLNGYYNFGPNAETYGKLNPDEGRARTLAQGKKIHGAPYETELDHSFSVAWHRTRYSKVVTAIHARVLAAPGGRT